MLQKHTKHYGNKQNRGKNMRGRECFEKQRITKKVSTCYGNIEHMKIMCSFGI